MWMTGDCVNRQDGPDGKVVISLSLTHGGMSSHLVEVKVCRVSTSSIKIRPGETLCTFFFYLCTSLERADTREGCGLPH